MYNYEWDIETGGYILLPSKITGVTKEVRPVFSEGFRQDLCAKRFAGSG